MNNLEIVHNKIFDRRANWNAINKELALKNRRVLELLREAALVESYLPIYTGKMNELFYDDLEATAIFTIESFEAYGHYYMLRRYLDIVGFNPINDSEVLELREKVKKEEFKDQIKELVNFMGTEHFAAQFFTDLSNINKEPVLNGLLPKFAAEEVSHSQFAFDLLKKRLNKNKELGDVIFQHALNYKHIGEYIIPTVSPAKEDNIKTIQSFNEKVEKLIGKRLSDGK